jgi:hypothetical protein
MVGNKGGSAARGPPFGAGLRARVGLAKKLRRPVAGGSGASLVPRQAASPRVPYFDLERSIPNPPTSTWAVPGPPTRTTHNTRFKALIRRASVWPGGRWRAPSSGGWSATCYRTLSLAWKKSPRRRARRAAAPPPPARRPARCRAATPPSASPWTSWTRSWRRRRPTRRPRRRGGTRPSPIAPPTRSISRCSTRASRWSPPRRCPGSRAPPSTRPCAPPTSGAAATRSRWWSPGSRPRPNPGCSPTAPCLRRRRSRRSP